MEAVIGTARACQTLAWHNHEPNQCLPHPLITASTSTRGHVSRQQSRFKDVYYNFQLVLLFGELKSR